MSDKVEESGDVLLKEYKVVCGVMLLKNLPNLSEKGQDVRKGSQLREDDLEEAVDGRGYSLASPVNVWGECKQRVDDDPNEDPNGIVEVGEAARYHGVEF